MKLPRFSSVLVATTLAGNVLLGAFALMPGASRGYVIDLVSRRDAGSAGGTINSANPVPLRDTGSTNAPDRAARLAAGREVRGLSDVMRTAGFPVEVARSVVRARITAQYATQFEMLSNEAPAPYWEADAKVSDPAKSAAWVALRREMTADLASALGTAYVPEDEGTSFETLKYRDGFLSDDTLRRLANPANNYALYNATRDDLADRAEERGLFPEEIQERTKNKQLRRAALESLLSPDELAEYDYRISSEAAVLRRRLAAFNPTEDEFRALFDIQQETTPRNTALPAVRQGQLDPQVQEQIRKALGNERYEEYLGSAGADISNASWLTSRLGLAPSAATQIVEIKSDIQSRAMTAAGGVGVALAPEVAEALRAETEKRIAAVVGTSGARAYVTAAATGAWLHSPSFSDPASPPRAPQGRPAQPANVVNVRTPAR